MRYYVQFIIFFEYFFKHRMKFIMFNFNLRFFKAKLTMNTWVMYCSVINQMKQQKFNLKKKILLEI